MGVPSFFPSKAVIAGENITVSVFHLVNEPRVWCVKNKNSTMKDEKAVHCRVAVLVSFSVVEGLQKSKENAHGTVSSDVYTPKIEHYSFSPSSKGRTESKHPTDSYLWPL